MLIVACLTRPVNWPTRIGQFVKRHAVFNSPRARLFLFGTVVERDRARGRGL